MNPIQAALLVLINDSIRGARLLLRGGDGDRGKQVALLMEEVLRVVLDAGDMLGHDGDPVAQVSGDEPPLIEFKQDEAGQDRDEHDYADKTSDSFHGMLLSFPGIDDSIS